jgi:polyisoprenoid-binding protein YceI
MQRGQHHWVLAIGLGLVGTAAASSAAVSGASDVHVTFHAMGPAGMKIDGTTSELTTAEDGKGNVVVKVPLARLQTGIKLRDDHMKDKYLEVGKFGTAELAIDKNALNLTPGSGKKVSASLTLHGQPQQVSVQYGVVAEKDKPGFRVTGSFHIDDMTKFGIAIPNYAGVKVKEYVDVEADFHVDAL